VISGVTFTALSVQKSSVAPVSSTAIRSVPAEAMVTRRGTPGPLMLLKNVPAARLIT
jgi:hypothetical protein